MTVIAQQLSEEAKEAIVTKAINRQGKSIRLIAQEHNVAKSTLYKWVKQYHNSSSASKDALPLTSKSCDTIAKRLEHIINTAQLDEQALGRYCRERGLYSHQLEKWKKDMISQDKTSNTAERAQLKSLKAENKLLKQDLRRKEKALAETSALLVLKKKAHLIWGEDEDA